MLLVSTLLKLTMIWGYYSTPILMTDATWCECNLLERKCQPANTFGWRIVCHFCRVLLLPTLSSLNANHFGFVASQQSFRFTFIWCVNWKGKSDGAVLVLSGRRSGPTRQGGDEHGTAVMETLGAENGFLGCTSLVSVRKLHRRHL